MNISSHITRWLFALSAAGYAIVALIALGLGVESRTFAVAMRISVVLLSVGALALFTRESSSSRPSSVLIIFLILYLARLIWDVPRFEETTDHLQFYCAVILLPVFSSSILANNWEDYPSARTSLTVGLAGCLLVVLASLLGFSDWRSTTVNSGGRFSYDVLDPITVGNIGAATSIAGWCVYRISRSPWSLIGVFAGLVCLAMGLSRGPIIAFVACVLVYLWIAGRVWMLLVASAVAIFFALTGYLDVVFETLRLGDLQGDVSANVRLLVLMSSIDQFLSSPIWGAGHVDNVTGLYPHNVFVESALALGVVGLGMAAFLVLRSLQIGLWRARSGEVFIFLNLVYWVVEAQFSGAIWSNVMLWMSMSIIICSRPPRNYLPIVEAGPRSNY